MISGQIPEELMEEFDKVRKKRGFTSRSEALRESIQYFIQQHSQYVPTEGHKIATISVHHDVRVDIMDKFVEIVEKYEPIVKSISQYNLRNRIVKTIIVAGPAEEIFEFYTTLAADRHFNAFIHYLVIKNPEEE